MLMVGLVWGLLGAEWLDAEFDLTLKFSPPLLWRDEEDVTPDDDEETGFDVALSLMYSRMALAISATSM